MNNLLSKMEDVLYHLELITDDELTDSILYFNLVDYWLGVVK